jgi:hypothetical protein
MITFPFFADWTDSIFEERGVLTSVFVAESGKEQRRLFRRKPEVALTMTFTADSPTLAALLNSILLRSTTEGVYVPAWQYVYQLTSDVASAATTIPVETVNTPWLSYGMLMKEEGTAELFEIDSVGSGVLNLGDPLVSAWSGGSYVVPCYRAWLEVNNVDWLAQDVLRASVVFRLWPLDEAALAGTAGDAAENAPQLIFPSRQANSPQEYATAVQTFRNPTGATVRGAAYPARSTLVYEGVFLDYDGAALWAWYGQRLGRLNTTWIPTFQKDLPLTTTVVAAATTIVIPKCGYGLLHAAEPGRRHIALMDGVSAYTVRKVNSVTDLGATEQLNLSAAAGIDLHPDYGFISFAHYARLTDDALTMEWAAPWVGTCTVKFTDLPDEAA